MSLNNYYTIYKHTAPNDKSYVGVTRQKDLNRRWQNGKGYIGCPLFNNAIQKYGWENFTHEILEDKVPIDQINNRESYWIAYYKSNNRQYGYNIESGGHAERTFSEETRKKISLALKNVPKTVEHREKLRQANLGKHPSEESRKKMSKTRSKPVYQMDLQGKILQEFNSIKEASLQTKCDSSYIAKCCKGKANTCGGFKWKYKEVTV